MASVKLPVYLYPRPPFSERAGQWGRREKRERGRTLGVGGFHDQTRG